MSGTSASAMAPAPAVPSAHASPPAAVQGESPDEVPAVALRLHPLRNGAGAGLPWGWRRIEDSGARVARFAPQPEVVDSDAVADTDADADHAHLSALHLIAHGTPPGHAAPVGPFELEHALAARICAVNGEPLPPGRRVPLQAGDEVQVGLLRLSFIAPVIAPHAVHDWPALPAPFGSDDARAVAQAGHTGATFAADGALPFGIHDALADAPRDAEDASRASSDSVPGTDPHASDAVLGELHRRYHATLIDPAAMGSEAPWRHEAVRTGAGSGAAPDAFAALVRPVGPDESLHDLLATPDAMDALIARADALGEGDLLGDEPAVSVLHLFAPASAHRAQAGHADGLEALLGAAPAAAPPEALSSLTRREHHLPAADSALRLGGTARRESDAEEDAEKNARANAQEGEARRGDEMAGLPGDALNDVNPGASPSEPDAGGVRHG